MVRSRSLLLWLAVGAVLIALSQMRWRIGPLAFIAPVPLLHVLREHRGLKARAWLLAALFVGYTLATLNFWRASKLSMAFASAAPATTPTLGLPPAHHTGQGPAHRGRSWPRSARGRGVWGGRRSVNDSLAPSGEENCPATAKWSGGPRWKSVPRPEHAQPVPMPVPATTIAQLSLDHRDRRSGSPQAAAEARQSETKNSAFPLASSTRTTTGPSTR